MAVVRAAEAVVVAARAAEAVTVAARAATAAMTGGVGVSGEAEGDGGGEGGVLSCGGLGGGEGFVAHEERRKVLLTFTVSPKNSKPSSTLNATPQWSTSVPEPTPPKVMP